MYYFFNTNFLISTIPTPITAIELIVIIAICNGVSLSSPVGLVIIIVSPQNSSSSFASLIFKAPAGMLSLFCVSQVVVVPS